MKNDNINHPVGCCANNIKETKTDLWHFISYLALSLQTSKPLILCLFWSAQICIKFGENLPTINIFWYDHRITEKGPENAEELLSEVTQIHEKCLLNIINVISEPFSA